MYTQDYFEIPSANFGRLNKVTTGLIAGSGRKPSNPSVNFRNDDAQSLSILEDVTDFGGGELDYEDEFNEENSDMAISEMEEPIIGKHGALYMRHGAFNLTTQQYPNAINMVRFN